MPSPEYQFTEIIRLEPESIGEPGKRTFRLIAESGTSSAILWLEKEQLFQLALAAQQVCDELPSSGDNADAPSELEAPEPEITCCRPCLGLRSTARARCSRERQ